MPTIVLTHRTLPNERKNVEFYAGDIRKLVNDQLKNKFTNVWVVGGASVANNFINLNLADEIRLSVIPIILGEGKLFFDQV